MHSGLTAFFSECFREKHAWLYLKITDCCAARSPALGGGIKVLAALWPGRRTQARGELLIPSALEVTLQRWDPGARGDRAAGSPACPAPCPRRAGGIYTASNVREPTVFNENRPDALKKPLDTSSHLCYEFMPKKGQICSDAGVPSAVYFDSPFWPKCNQDFDLPFTPFWADSN